MVPEYVIAIVEHRPELPKTKRLPSPTEASMPVEDRSWRAGSDEDGDDSHKGQNDRENSNGQHNIQSTLADPVLHSVRRQAKNGHSSLLPVHCVHLSQWITTASCR